MRPHISFDDQMTHLEQLTDIPAVHIPFGIANKSSQDAKETQGEGKSGRCLWKIIFN